MNMEITAKVVEVLPTRKGVSKKSGKEWAQASIIVEYGGEYAKKLLLTNSRNVEEFTKLKVGDTYAFSIDAESRKYQDSWFTTINCWRWVKPHVGGTPFEKPTDDTPAF
jgi:hypothetical protein